MIEINGCFSALLQPVAAREYQVTRTTEVDIETRQARMDKRVGEAVGYRFEGQLSHAGAVLTGLSFKMDGMDCLMTIKAVLAGRDQVAFVGGPDWAVCIVHGTELASRDGLKWREDKFSKK